MEQENRKPDISSLKIDRNKKFSDRPRSRAWLWLVAVIVAAGSVAAYWMFRESITPGIVVETGRVRILDGSEATTELVATGYVVAQRKAEVASKGTGRLEWLGFEEGDDVLKGQVIAQLDNDDIKAGLALAQANLRGAEVDTLDTGRNYRRQLDLFSTGAVTDMIVEAAEAAYKNALALWEARAAAVRVAEVDLDNTYIKAPFDGTILTKNADIGEIVAPFASSASSKGSVVTLADMSSLEVEADVAESNIYKVFPSQKCEIILDAYSGTRYAGYVKKIVPTADRARATVLTKIAFEDIDERVLPEMSARVNFLLEDTLNAGDGAKVTIVVAREAITRRNGNKIAFRVDGNHVMSVEVTLGRDLGQVVEVTGGLNPGDEVVLSPPGKLKSGQKIEISL